MKDLVGPYRIESPLGHGGMGIVYLGIHDHLGREVAIKALAPELTRHPEFRERFFAEARVQARLQHTNIVTIYDLIEDEGGFFIVMEHVPGPTLEALLKEKGGKEWDLGHSLALFRQILAGLDYAHSKGVIHRDVKPSNVLVADGDLVKLTDFGIALLIGDKRLTASQSTIGTPIYMSPEQILRPRSVDHRSDVYSAAIVLYEMLAGQPPFDAETEYEIKKLQIEAPVPDVRALKGEVPAEIAEALSVALRKLPEERFQSAGAFLRALSGSKETLPAVETPREVISSPEPLKPSLREQLLESYRRHSRMYQAAAASLILVSGLVPFLISRAGRDPEPLPERPVRPEASVANAVRTELAASVDVAASPPSVIPPDDRGQSRLPGPQPLGIGEPSPNDRAKVLALKAKIRAGAARVEEAIADKEFELARKELDLLRTVADLRAEDLASELSRLGDLEESIARGIKNQKREEAQQTVAQQPETPGAPEPLKGGARAPAKEAPEREPASSGQFEMRAYAIEKTGYKPSKGFMLRVEEVVAPSVVNARESMNVVTRYIVLSPDPQEAVVLKATIRLLSSDHFAFVLKERNISVPEGGGMMEFINSVEVGVKPGMYELQVILLDSKGRLQASGSSGSFLRVN